LKKYPEIDSLRASNWKMDIVSHYSIGGKDYLLSRVPNRDYCGDENAYQYLLIQIGRNSNGEFCFHQVKLGNDNSDLNRYWNKDFTDEDARNVVTRYLQNRALAVSKLQKRYQNSRYQMIFEDHLDTEIDEVISGWMDDIKAETGSIPYDFTVEFEFESPVYIPTNRISMKSNQQVTRKALRIFVSKTGELAYHTSRTRGFALSKLPRDRMIGMRVLEKKTIPEPFDVRAAKIAEKIHPNLWPDLKKELLENPSKYDGDQRLKTVSIKQAFGGGRVGDYVVSQLREAIEQRKPFTYNTQGTKRDKSVEVKVDADGTVRAFYSSEFSGQRNGSYYLVINPETALYYEDD
jgi:hypothetical protein